MSKPNTKTPQHVAIEGIYVCSHGPNGGPPYSRQIVLVADGERLELQTLKFPSDYAAQQAAQEFRKAFLHAFGNSPAPVAAVAPAPEGQPEVEAPQGAPR